MTLLSQRLFVRAFSLYLKHDYYADGRCPDFLIEPSGDTEKLLSNLRGVLKSGPDWISLHIDPQLQKPALGATFRFHLRPRNPDFALITDTQDISAMAAPLYTSDGAVTEEPGQPLELLLVDRPPTQKESFDHSSRHADIFADVELRVDGDWESLGEAGWVPLEFEVSFASRSTFWIYFLVTDRSNGAFSIESQEQDEGDELTFSGKELEPLDTSDAIASWLARQYADPGQRRFRFVSEQPVLCRQAARKNIQLLDGTNPLFSCLPNPSLRNLATRPLAGDSAQAEDALFQVVTYLTHSFPTSGA